ncbi:MAG: hypothetical protein QOJ92_2991 [Frankiales bacterium]|nr:hypothetical protein [Frankiales bacterium]
MRWEALFADLEAELAAAEAAELAGEVADRTRSALAQTRLADRLRAAQGAELELVLLGGLRVRGRLAASGPDWSLIAESSGAELLVPHEALAAVAGAGTLGESSASVVDARLDFASALRGIARRRAGVRVRLLDGTESAGTIDRVGADALDLALHPEGEARRRGAVRQVVIVPLKSLGSVRAD